MHVEDFRAFRVFRSSKRMYRLLLSRYEASIRNANYSENEALVKKTIGLDGLSHKGRNVPELNEDAVRELTLYSYRILYEIKSDDFIVVLAVIHKRRQVEPEEILREQ